MINKLSFAIGYALGAWFTLAMVASAGYLPAEGAIAGLMAFGVILCIPFISIYVWLMWRAYDEQA